jgi:hypothetical protein
MLMLESITTATLSRTIVASRGKILIQFLLGDKEHAVTAVGPGTTVLSYMSMFAHRKTCPHPERAAVLQALDGNLCRCTGYRPILDAAEKMYQFPMEDQFTTMETSTIASLQRIAGQIIAAHNADDTTRSGQRGVSFHNAKIRIAAINPESSQG